ncbi:type II toxin-antitoxin system PemK/MazF family toxin [Candidatus Woesearchaeota archaeon]|nr:type II toxin-antitoxin system PemK/MazF family toxin [Candidatus Woesearchaeota archaeon]
MEKLVKGDVVVLPFPFSDLSASKKRPAVVVAMLQGEDVICCQITSETRFDNYSINLSNNDFKEGGLQVSSMIRPNRIFTADRSIISYKAGALKERKVKEIESVLVKIFAS